MEWEKAFKYKSNLKEHILRMHENASPELFSILCVFSDEWAKREKEDAKVKHGNPTEELNRRFWNVEQVHSESNKAEGVDDVDIQFESEKQQVEQHVETYCDPDDSQQLVARFEVKSGADPDENEESDG